MRHLDFSGYDGAEDFREKVAQRLGKGSHGRLECLAGHKTSANGIWRS
jgi:hypothetical protein